MDIWQDLFTPAHLMELLRWQIPGKGSTEIETHHQEPKCRKAWAGDDPLSPMGEGREEESYEPGWHEQHGGRRKMGQSYRTWALRCLDQMWPAREEDCLDWPVEVQNILLATVCLCQPSNSRQFGISLILLLVLLCTTELQCKLWIKCWTTFGIVGKWFNFDFCQLISLNKEENEALILTNNTYAIMELEEFWNLKKGSLAKKMMRGRWEVLIFWLALEINISCLFLFKEVP